MHKTAWLMLALLTVLSAFAFQGSRGLYETTEGRYAECAREMIERKDYLQPTLSYRPHWTKPPVAYWAIAGGMKLLPREWGVRLYGSVALCLTVLAVTLLGATLWDRKTGLIAGFVYATSPFPAIAAHVVSTDTLLALWEVAAVLCYVAARRASPKVSRGLIVAMWLFFGLGFLTKGPPALLPLLPMLIWHLRSKPGIRLAGLYGLGVAAFAVVGLSWYAVALFRNPQLVSYLLGQEVVGRLVTSARNPEWYKPLTLYLPSLAFGGGIWFCFGLKAIINRRLLRSGRLWAHVKSSSKGFFLLLWVLLPLVVFALVRSRLPLYVLPFYAPIALATARGISLSYPRHALRTAAVAAMIAAGCIVMLKAEGSGYPKGHNMALLYEKCRSAGGPEAEVIVFNSTKLHGLQFYLDGRLRRVTESGKEPNSDGCIADLISEMKERPKAATYVVVAQSAEGDNLCRTLSGANVQYDLSRDEAWFICSIGTTRSVCKAPLAGPTAEPPRP